MGKKPARRVSFAEAPIITLTTDFGMKDYFVGAVKGVILSANPAIHIVDITHEIPAQDVEAAAFTLLAVCEAFPEGTIHVAVVDPGVGSTRKTLIVQSGGQLFVGPDNGIFGYVMKDDALVYEVTNTDYFRKPLSQTFHGRDVFAPLAAALSNGTRPSQLGKRTRTWVRLPEITPKHKNDGTIEGRIIHIDRFGNCVTNLTSGDISDKQIASGVVLSVGSKQVTSFRSFYAEGPGNSRQAFAIWGSAGFLEIAVQNRSAAALLKIKRGDKVVASSRSVK